MAPRGNYTLSSSDEEPEIKLSSSSTPRRRRIGTTINNKQKGSDTTLGVLANNQSEPTMVKKFIEIEKRKNGMTKDQFFQYYNQLLILDFLNQEDRTVDLPLGLSSIFSYFSEVTGVKQADSLLVNKVLGEESVAEPSTSTVLPPPSTPSKASQESDMSTPVVHSSPKKRRKAKRNSTKSSKKSKVETPKKPLTTPEKEEIPTTSEDEELSDGTYKVEKLVDKKVVRKKQFYLVKWDGYPDSENTWEPKDNISMDLIHIFEQKRKK